MLPSRRDALRVGTVTVLAPALATGGLRPPLDRARAAILLFVAGRPLPACTDSPVRTTHTG
jgi:hypothetical protein